jgi:hypothetical protein
MRVVTTEPQRRKRERPAPTRARHLQLWEKCETLSSNPFGLQEVRMHALISGTRNVLALRSNHHDQAIHESVKRVLKTSGYRALAGLRCRVDRGVVELAGDVPTFYLKQLAQEAVLRLDHVNQVKNRVQVI